MDATLFVGEVERVTELDAVVGVSGSLAPCSGDWSEYMELSGELMFGGKGAAVSAVGRVPGDCLV